MTKNQRQYLTSILLIIFVGLLTESDIWAGVCLLFAILVALAFVYWGDENDR